MAENINLKRKKPWNSQNHIFSGVVLDFHPGECFQVSDLCDKFPAEKKSIMWEEQYVKLTKCKT